MKRVIFIGQAMPRYKSHPHDWPTLNNWLYSIGLTIDDVKTWFMYSALVDYFPGAKNGSHLVPTPEQIEKDRPRLIKTIRNFNPEIVVPIGKLSLAYCLEKKAVHLEDHIGQIHVVNPYRALGTSITVIPLPHPSGASTWYKKPKNFRLLQQALKALKAGLN